MHSSPAFPTALFVILLNLRNGAASTITDPLLPGSGAAADQHLTY
jgi:hypothetical protein